MPNGARLRFDYLERDSDADNYQGHSYTRVYVEEAGNFRRRRRSRNCTPRCALVRACRAGCG